MPGSQSLTDQVSSIFFCPIRHDINIEPLQFLEGGHVASSYFSNALKISLNAGNSRHPLAADENLKAAEAIISQENYWAKAAFLYFSKQGLIDISLVETPDKLAKLLIDIPAWGVLPEYYKSVITPGMQLQPIPPLLLAPDIPECPRKAPLDRLIILPILANDGAIYDLAMLIEALKNKWTSPITGQLFAQESLRISLATAKAISVYLETLPNADIVKRIILDKQEMLYNELQINKYVTEINELITHNPIMCSTCQKRKQLLSQAKTYEQVYARIGFSGGSICYCLFKLFASEKMQIEYYDASKITKGILMSLGGLCFGWGIYLQTVRIPQLQEKTYNGFIPHINEKAERTPAQILKASLVTSQITVITQQPRAMSS